MRYIDSYRFAFQSDAWQKNLLFASVSILIPYVAMTVLLGYLFEVIEFKHRHEDEEPYADFDFNRFVDYLKRGGSEIPLKAPAPPDELDGPGAYLP